MGKNDRCCVYQCHHDRNEGASCSFYQVPRHPQDLAAKYQALLKYDVFTNNGKKIPWTPTINSKICSCHWPIGQQPDPKTRVPGKMRNLPSMFPDRPLVKTRPASTWQLRHDLHNLEEDEFFHNEAVTADVDVQAEEPDECACESAETSTADHDHDYLKTNTDKTSELLMDVIRAEHPEMYSYLSETVTKAQAYDKALSNLSLS